MYVTVYVEYDIEISRKMNDKCERRDERRLASCEVNDVIVDVNGATLDTGMVAMCKAAQILTVTFLRREL